MRQHSPILEVYVLDLAFDLVFDLESVDGVVLVLGV